MPPLAEACGQLVDDFTAPQLPLIRHEDVGIEQRSSECVTFCIISLGGADAMHPLLIVSKNEEHRRGTLQTSADERKLMALARQRVKLVTMLATCRMSPARRVRLRAKLANVDEMIRLCEADRLTTLI